MFCEMACIWTPHFVPFTNQETAPIRTIPITKVTTL